MNGDGGRVVSVVPSSLGYINMYVVCSGLFWGGGGRIGGMLFVCIFSKALGQSIS